MCRKQYHHSHLQLLEAQIKTLPAEHDIVALTPELFQTSSLSQTRPDNTSVFCQLHDSHDFHKHNTLNITCGDISISVAPAVSDEKLVGILKALRYA